MKERLWLLLLVLGVCLAYGLGYWQGKQTVEPEISIKTQPVVQLLPTPETPRTETENSVPIVTRQDAIPSQVQEEAKSKIPDPLAQKRLVEKSLNPNTASASELERLPGIGPKLAARIVEWRQTHGPFKKPADLRRVSGIGHKLLQRIEPYLSFK